MSGGDPFQTAKSNAVSVPVSSLARAAARSLSPYVLRRRAQGFVWCARSCSDSKPRTHVECLEREGEVSAKRVIETTRVEVLEGRDRFGPLWPAQPCPSRRSNDLQDPLPTTEQQLLCYRAGRLQPTALAGQSQGRLPVPTKRGARATAAELACLLSLRLPSLCTRLQHTLSFPPLFSVLPTTRGCTPSSRSRARTTARELPGEHLKAKERLRVSPLLLAGRPFCS